MAEYLVTDSDMTKVADAIRAKGGTTEALAWPDGYKTAIDAIQSGGGGVEEVDISFIKANNRSGYNGKMILNGVFGKLNFDFASNSNYNFELSNPIPINEFFNDIYVAFDTLTNATVIFSLNIIGGDAGQSGLLIIIQRA